MKYFKIRSESDHWCGCWNEIYVPAEREEDLEQLISYNEEYVRTELVDTPDEEDEEWFEEYDLVSSDVEEVTEEEYLRYKD
jgi:hypothetical protein